MAGRGFQGPYSGAGFHIVLRGNCWVLPDDGDAVALGTGDAVLLPHGTGHVLADRAADTRTVAQTVPFEQWSAAVRAETASGAAR